MRIPLQQLVSVGGVRVVRVRHSGRSEHGRRRRHVTGVAVVEGLAAEVGEVHAGVVRVGGVGGVVMVMVLL